MAGHGLALEQTRDEAPILAGGGDNDSAQLLLRNNDFRKQKNYPPSKLRQ
jgi:hypothetical protein